MDLEQSARRKWQESAESWMKQIEKGDNNRTFLLDAPMAELCGDVRDANVLDLGCGEGRFARMLTDLGAMVTGIDPTFELLRRAASEQETSRWVRGVGESLPFKHDAFDLVVSYLTLLDIPDFLSAIRESWRVLKPGGRMLVANVNPFASTRTPAWHRNEASEKVHLAVEEYFTEREQMAEWAGISILNWHRPLEAYMTAFLHSGFQLIEYREPRPTPEILRAVPEMKQLDRVPFFHIMLWQKPDGKR